MRTSGHGSPVSLLERARFESLSPSEQVRHLLDLVCAVATQVLQDAAGAGAPERTEPFAADRALREQGVDSSAWSRCSSG
ncbi:hypothetical protein SHKM778_32350 [Streptomyces sp. KM77-8]|uniref:Uncharacterized protein n=1 Tax=Streptomyces haneummycinicus TaxID=3074435 RepID=A0AAT9HI50_9ACTN